MKKHYWILFVCLIFAAVNSLNAQDVSVYQKVDSLIMANQVSEAEEVLDMESDTYDYYWRKSRLLVLKGDATENKDQQKDAYNQALEYANKAIKANKKGSLGYIRRAAANGKLALFEGVLTANTYVNEVRDDAEKALKLKSTDEYNLATAYYILGRTHLKLSETPAVLRMPLELDWGNLDEALENLKKAVDLRPDFIMYHYDYARALIEYEEEEKAKKVLQGIADLPFREPGDDQRKRDAIELLKSL